MKYHVSWIDKGGCDIFDVDVYASDLVMALNGAMYIAAREDLDTYMEVIHDATKVIIQEVVE